MKHSVRMIMPPVIFLFMLLAATACNNRGRLGHAGEIKQYLTSTLAKDTAGEIASKVKMLDSMPLLKEEDCRLFYKEVNKLTFNMHYIGRDAEAIVILRHMLAMLGNAGALNKNDSRQMVNLYIRLGATFFDMGMTGLGLDYYRRGLDLCTDRDYDDVKAMLYNNIAIIYGDCGMPEKSKKYFNKALAINLRLNNHEETFLNYANLAELYSLDGNIHQALEASQRSLDFVDQQKHPRQLASMRVQQGKLYERLGQYDVAMSRYNSALRQYRELSDIRGLINAYLHISNAHLEREATDSAIIYAGKAWSLCEFHGRDDDMISTLRTFSNIYSARGDDRIALEYYSRLMALTDSLQKAERRLRLTNLDGIGIDMMNGTQQHLAESQHWWIYVVLVFALILSGILLFLYLRVRKRCRIGENENLRVSILHDKEINQVNRELTTLSLEKVRQQECIADVTASLKQVLLELNPRETAKRKNIQSLLARLSQLSSENADDEFKVFFERVHPGFYKILGERFPQLTSRDMRLCAFLYLGLSTKEIAALTYREVRSVDSARNRLRKKLGLDLSEDLTVYLRSVAISG